MSELFALQTALAGAMNKDSLLCLAHAAAWLDPLRGAVDDMDVPESEDDTVFVALQILRRAFPDTYFDALQAIRLGASYQQLDQLICNAVQAQGIPLESLDWIGYGIPLPAYGVRLDDPDFYREWSQAPHRDVVPVLQCFGISPEPNPYNVVIAEVTYQVADHIATDLLQQTEDRWRQVGWLLKWLTSGTGNSSCDCDHDALAEFQPLSWDADDIAFAREIVEEADGIMADVLAGLEWINGQPNALEALSRNIREVYPTKGRNHAEHRLEWPRIAGSDERGTADLT
jgi:hypothetical protein